MTVRTSVIGDGGNQSVQASRECRAVQDQERRRLTQCDPIQSVTIADPTVGGCRG